MCRLSERLEELVAPKSTCTVAPRATAINKKAPMFGVMSDMSMDRFCAGVTSGPAGQKGPSSIERRASSCPLESAARQEIQLIEKAAEIMSRSEIAILIEAW